MVGTSGITRGPSLPISTSAASSSLCAATKSRRPIEPRSSQVSSTSFRLKPEFPSALREHRFQCAQVQRVLALVVRTAAAIPAIAFLGEPPGIEAGAPLVLQAAHGIAVAVGQDRRTLRILEALGREDGAEPRLRIGMNSDDEAHALQPRPDRAVQVALHVGLVAGVLRRAGNRHQFGQPVAEAVAVEELQRTSDCARACAHRLPPMCPAQRAGYADRSGSREPPTRRRSVCEGLHTARVTRVRVFWC